MEEAMKKRIRILIAALVFGWTFLAEAHDVEVVLYPTIGPVSVAPIPDIEFPGIVSPSFSAFAANVLDGMQKGRGYYGGSILVTPTAFNTIGAPIVQRPGKVKVSVYDTWATKGKSWRGLTPLHGPFANERGTQFRAAVAINSRSTFTLADVILSATFAYAPGQVFQGPLGGPAGKGAFQSFASNRLRGIYWGRDGRPGGGDDRVYDRRNPGSYKTPINQLLFVGQGELGFADTSDEAGTDVEQFAGYVADLKAFAPFTFTYTYSLRGASSTVVVAVDLTTRPGPKLPPRSHHRFRPFGLYPIR
jgi:hypothetical protein